MSAHPTAAVDDRSGPSGRLAQVWFCQDRIFHYRVPIWDRLCEVAEGVYEITVHGNLEDGRAYGGEARPYFRDRELDLRRFLGQRYQFWPDMDRRVREQRPEGLVIEANPRNLSCWRIAKLCRRLGIPIIGWTKVQSFSGLPAFVRQPLKGRFYRLFDYMICYGHTAREEMTALGYPADRVQIAQNTIDTRRIFEESDRFATLAAELRQRHGLTDRRILLCCGTMYPKKRHMQVVEAWPRIRDLDPDLVLAIVGGGETFDAVRARASEVDPDRIIVTGRVPEGEDYVWIGASDINVFAGGLGLAINQCLAFGKSTIVADEPGPDSEILEHGKTGWRYPRDDVDALVAAISHVLERPDEVERISAAARKMMRERVTIENMVEKIDGIIRQALAESPRAAGVASTTAAVR